MKKILFLNNVAYPIYDLVLPELKKHKDYRIYFLIASGKKSGAWSYQQKLKSGIKLLFSVKLTIPLGYDKFNLYINPTILIDLVKINPDVIVMAGWDQPSYIVAFFYGKLFGKKLILWSGSTAREESFIRRFTKPFVKFILKYVDYIITYGTKSKKYILSLGDFRKKIIMGYYVCDNKFFMKKNKELLSKKAILKKKLGIPDKLTFLYVGQLIKRKGLDFLIKAFHRLDKTGVSLLICGDGEEKERLKKQVLRSKINNIYFIGAKKLEDLPEIYNAADVFILPSLIEVWGLVVNEAMASGLPVVVSKYAGASADLVREGKNGFTFDPKNSNELVKIFHYFIKNKDKSRIMGKESLKMIKSVNVKQLADAFHLAFSSALSV